MRNDDRCSSVVAWPQTIEKLDDMRFAVVCGDTTDQAVLLVSATPAPNDPNVFLAAEGK